MGEEEEDNRKSSQIGSNRVSYIEGEVRAET